jgi:5-formyltetrahydrofolate cyclo-ligase
MPNVAGDAQRSRSPKAALRYRLLAQRKSLPPSTRQAAAAAIHVTLLSLVRRVRPSTIAGYVPVGAEPGGPELPSVLATTAPVLLPVLLPDGDLDWAPYDGSLTAGPRGLLEPPGPRLGVDAVQTAGLVVVPALAVDRSGMRLGRGGGSYDRVLDRLATDVLTVALLNDGELLDAVPTEPHDRPVRAVITPSGGLALSPGTEWTNDLGWRTIGTRRL